MSLHDSAFIRILKASALPFLSGGACDSVYSHRFIHRTFIPWQDLHHIPM